MGVENNKKAIELLINSSGNNGENVDLILVDLKYPGISEIEFIDTLKKNKIDIPFGVLAEYDTNRLRAILKSRKCKILPRKANQFSRIVPLCFRCNCIGHVKGSKLRSGKIVTSPICLSKPVNESVKCI